MPPASLFQCHWSQAMNRQLLEVLLRIDRRLAKLERVLIERGQACFAVNPKAPPRARKREVSVVKHLKVGDPERAGSKTSR